jgi:FKBP-type peptidyl-prolyl cis-trans isomerase
MIKTTTLAFVFIVALAACAESPALASAQTTTIRVIPAPEDVAAPPADASKTASGLASKIITAGTGKTHPAAANLVTVHYTGWTTDGKMFDSSVSRGKPSTFPLDKVIAGWTEGVQLMVAGETRRFWIPEALAYKGQQGRPKGILVFDVELISFTESPTQAPADVKNPPSDARRTASGLSYKVLTAGVGGRHPKSSSAVTVHYSGWTTDGKLFDSSVVRGVPTTFPLDNVIPGWTEGVQLMVEGEKTRFWIPEALAYKGQPGQPKGMLVFDIELIKIN